MTTPNPAPDFVTFDLAGPGLETVTVRRDHIVAVETHPKHPGTCVLRLHPSLFYRVDGVAADVLAALGETR